MKLHFQETPWDLYAIAAYAVVVAAVLLALNVGNFGAIFLVLFVPGYVLVAALFPGLPAPEKPEIEWIERIALSFGLSIAVVPLLGLLLSITPFGIRLAPIVVTITLFTVGVGYVAYVRRMRLPTNQRLSLSVNLGLPRLDEYSLLERSLAVGLAASVVVATTTLAFVVLTPRPAKTFTEFYLLGPGGNASGYPTKLNVSQTGTVILGVANHEAATVRYTLSVQLIGVRVVYNATSGLNQTEEINRTIMSSVNVTLTDGKNWTQPYTFKVSSAGLWKVQFILFKNNDISYIYRELHLFVTVG